MKKTVVSALALVVVVLALAGTLGFYQVRATVNAPADLVTTWSSSGERLRITSVAVFDDHSGQLRQAEAVDIEEGLIARVYWAGDEVPASQVETLRGEGRTLLPGLTDFHVHLGSSDGRPPWALDGIDMISVAGQREAFLYSGVTSVVEGSPNALASLDQALAPSPAIYQATRMITAEDGHPIPMFREFVPWPMTEMAINEQVLPIGSAAASSDALDALVNGPGHHVKLVLDGAIPWDSPRLAEADVRAVVERAHAAGKPVYTHVGSAQDAVIAARAGSDVLMHTPYVDLLSDDDLAELKASGVVVVTTAQIWEWFERGLDKQPPLTPLEQELASPGLLTAWGHDWHQATADYHSTTFSQDYLSRLSGFNANLAENVKRLYQAGVPQVIGTDTGIPGLTPGASTIRELQLLQSYGFEPTDLLRMATVAPGALLGNSGLGRIQPGSPADLLLVDGDPTQDIAELAKLAFVIREGVVYQRHR
ncbi:amidohydrolase family protein [Marinobacter zhejiangensis]|uniref:Imidazolonepropionase n=1 Tax=Marinobacter zhejiangensis TaxID=488535 RepID=A0A1I4M2R6_9GAMM|nr:amidohydrolase family protein [Marinobacter zhejiangensis]SFL97678.1 Imidazolonepropionase [Marinobacter zhejiangensis]